MILLGPESLSTSNVGNLVQEVIVYRIGCKNTQREKEPGSIPPPDLNARKLEYV